MADVKDTSIALAAMLDRLAKQRVSVKKYVPEVRASVVENYAKKMSVDFGYCFSKESLEMLINYLKGYNILVIGQVGIGKTYFFDCINKIRSAKFTDRIIKLSMIETQGWDMDIARTWVEDYRDHDVLIDDVGTEPKMNSWGQEAELFPYLLEMRMQLQGNRMRTHMTTNLIMSELEARYGKRVRDRLDQVFKPIALVAKKSKRKDSLVPWRVSENGGGVL